MVTNMNQHNSTPSFQPIKENLSSSSFRGKWKRDESCFSILFLHELNFNQLATKLMSKSLDRKQCLFLTKVKLWLSTHTYLVPIFSQKNKNKSSNHHHHTPISKQLQFCTKGSSFSIQFNHQINLHLNKKSHLNKKLKSNTTRFKML